MKYFLHIFYHLISCYAGKESYVSRLKFFNVTSSCTKQYLPIRLHNQQQIYFPIDCFFPPPRPLQIVQTLMQRVNFWGFLGVSLTKGAMMKYNINIVARYS